MGDRFNKKGLSVKNFSTVRKFLGGNTPQLVLMQNAVTQTLLCPLWQSKLLSPKSKLDITHLMLSYHVAIVVSLLYHTHVGTDQKRQAFLIFLTVLWWHPSCYQDLFCGDQY